MNAMMSIGAAAQVTGCSVPTIRYYEQIGLLPTGHRTDAGRRIFDDSALQRLTFIRRCRDFGFSIEQVREMVGLADNPNRPCMELREIAAGHLTSLRAKLAELMSLERDMATFVQECDTACAGGAVLNCTILDQLAEMTSTAQGRASGCCTC